MSDDCSARFERGLTVEFRAEPQPNDDSDEGKALGIIVALSKGMKFPPPAQEPLLLTAMEVLDGELHKRTYKKTTTTTTKSSTKKEKKDHGDAKE